MPTKIRRNGIIELPEGFRRHYAKKIAKKSKISLKSAYKILMDGLKRRWSIKAIKNMIRRFKRRKK